jgi:hypothetical protein
LSASNAISRVKECRVLSMNVHAAERSDCSDEFVGGHRENELLRTCDMTYPRVSVPCPALSDQKPTQRARFACHPYTHRSWATVARTYLSWHYTTTANQKPSGTLIYSGKLYGVERPSRRWSSITTPVCPVLLLPPSDPLPPRARQVTPTPIFPNFQETTLENPRYHLSHPSHSPHNPHHLQRIRYSR